MSPTLGKLYRNTKTGVVGRCLSCKSVFEEYDYYVLPKGMRRITENLQVWCQDDMEPHGEEPP